MFKSILLAGVLLVTSNFMPSSSLIAPTVLAANIAPAAPVVNALGPIYTVPPTVMAHVKPPAVQAGTFRISFNPEAGDALQPEEAEFIARINQERTARGLNALSLDPALVTTARGHSHEMCERDYFDHHSPTPGICTPMDRYLSTLHSSGDRTPNYLLVGENIYYCSESTDTYNVAYGHQALMNSPGHRANILEPRFAKVGVGVYRNAQGEFWVTEMFMKD